jgi:hypothetical protein
MFKNVACVKGDRVTFVYDDPHKAVKEQRTGVVEKVGSHFICIKDENRMKFDGGMGAFRSFTASFVSDFRVLQRVQAQP